METYKQTIVDHSIGDYPREACGIVVKTPSDELIAIPLPNIAPQPQKHFTINPSAFLEALKQGELQYCYHSHPNGPPTFSPADIRVAEMTSYKSLLYSMPDKIFATYDPSGVKTPLEGRRFVMGVFDCVTLVDDYYEQKFNVKFPLHATSLEDITDGNGDIKTHITDRNLQIVDIPKEGDIILFALAQNQKVNHCAIYLGDHAMLHQLINKKSCKEVYGGHWKSATVCFLRHSANQF